MNLTIIGSTGRTGRQVLIEGLRRGHRITAFTRRPDALRGADALARVVGGDARDPHTVREAITGADAVIAIIAAASRKGPHHTAEASQVITKAMTETGVRRLVVTSAYPIVAERPRVLIAVLRRLLAAPYADLAEMERCVRASDLDWTIARLNRLTDKPALGSTQLSRALLDSPSSITRADAAAALLDLAEDDRTARTAINIAGPG